MLPEFREFIVADNGAKANGILFRTSIAKPLIVFCPGDGEKGDGTSNTLELLYKNGSPVDLARQDKLAQYHVLGMQGVGGRGIQGDQIGYLIENSKTLLNASKILITGLSLGGAAVLEAAGNARYASLYALCVAMSAPSITNELVDWSKLTCPVLLIHGDKDTGLTDYWNSIRVRDAINKVKPGFAYVITIPGGGHGGWSTWYARGWSFTIGATKYADIYDLFDKITPTFRFPNETGSTDTGGVQDGTGGSTTTQPNTQNKMTPNFTVTKDAAGNIVLDPSTSVGLPASWNWDFFDPSNSTKFLAQEIVSGAMNGNNTMPQKLVIKPPKTDVNVFLYMSAAGQRLNKMILVPASGLPTVPSTPAKTIISKTLFIAYSDGTFDTVKQTIN